MNYNYFVPLIGFSGLIFGVLLAKIAYSEIRESLRYFEVLRKVILAGLIVVLLLSLNTSVLSLLIGVVLGYLSGMLLGVYFYLGLGSVLSILFSKNLFFLCNVFVFLYGLPKGSVMRRFKFKELYMSFLLFVIGYLFLIVLNYANIFNFLIGVSSGGLFYSLVRRRFISL